MLDALVLVLDALIGRRVIGVDYGVRLGILSYETLQCALVRALDYLGVNPVGRQVFRADDRHHVHRATARRCLALGVRHVLALPANIGFVEFYRAVKGAFAVAGPCFPNTMQHGPRGGLRHTDIPVELHAGNALEARQAKVYCDDPFAKRDVRARDRRSGANTEIRPAIGAPIGHGLRVRNLAGPGASALPAMAFAVRPYDRLKPIRGGSLGREHVHELDQGKPFTVRFSGCFLHHFKSPFQHHKYRDKGSICQVGLLIPFAWASLEQP